VEKIMTKSAIKKSMLQLPATDRLELMEHLEVSLAKDEQRIPLQEWQKKLIEERMTEHRKNPANVVRGDEFVAKLRDTATRMRAAGRAKKN
jgi:putative addiction module component (TIGR02574 family)